MSDESSSTETLAALIRIWRNELGSPAGLVRRYLPEGSARLARKNGEVVPCPWCKREAPTCLVLYAGLKEADALCQACGAEGNILGFLGAILGVDFDARTGLVIGFVESDLQTPPPPGLVTADDRELLKSLQSRVRFEGIRRGLGKIAGFSCYGYPDPCQPGTQQPLVAVGPPEERLSVGGFIGPGQLSWLYQRDLAGLFDHFACFQNRAVFDLDENPDRRAVRSVLHEFSGTRWQQLLPLRFAERLLRCLGITLSTDNRSVTLGFAPPDPSLSSGQVKTASSFEERTGRGTRHGLFCESTFGTARPGSCRCGRGSLHDTCPVCGETGLERFERLGHISLPCAVVPAHLRFVVRALLGERGQQLLQSRDPAGDISLEHALAEVDLFTRAAALPVGTPERALVEEFRCSGVPATSLLWRTLLVPPANFRPSKPGAADGISDACRRAVGRSNRLRDLTERKAPREIRHNERRMLSESVDLLVRQPRWLPSAEPTIFDLVHFVLSRRPIQYVRGAVRGAAVVDSTRSVLGAPNSVMAVFRRAKDAGVDTSVLLASGRASLVGTEWEGIDEVSFRVPTDLARRLGLASGDLLHLYLPWGDSANSETRRLQQSAEPPITRVEKKTVLDSCEDPEQAMELLVRAALRGETVHPVNAHVAWLVGGLR